MKKVPWWHTEIGEIEKHNVLSAFEKKRFSLGPITQELESQLASLLQVPYVLVTPSGTAAITMTLMAVGVRPRDEVIVPDLTWIATAQAASILGARVVFADCLPNVPLINPVEVKKKITPRTKAIIPVHYNGRPCQMEELMEIARNANVALIEDTCKALLSKSSIGYLGTLGDFGCYSLGLVSLISTGYGGFVVTSDKKQYERLRLIRDHGVQRGEGEEYLTIGFNFKFSDILASIGIGQLSRLEEKLRNLRAVYQRYVTGLALLPYIDVIPVDVEAGQVPLLVDVRSKHAAEIIAYLNQNGVETVRLHPPLHLAQYFHQSGSFPNASRFASEGFNLPCGPSQPLENVDFCIKLLHEWNPNSSSLSHQE